MFEGLFGPVLQFTDDPLCASGRSLPVEVGGHSKKTPPAGAFHLIRPQHCIKASMSCMPSAMVILMQTFSFHRSRGD